MEEKNLTEKESLELIARMISKSKKRLEIGDGNVFLYWGTLSRHRHCRMGGSSHNTQSGMERSLGSHGHRCAL